jgi:PhnB protein
MAILNPYINLDSSARQALEFYHGIFGGKLTMSTFKEFGASQDPSDDDKIMHGQVDGDNGITLMVSDAPSWIQDRPTVSNISISLSGADEDNLRRYWDGLAAGATINQPLVSAPWGDTFGMLTDQFGVDWMVNITAPRG